MSHAYAYLFRVAAVGVCVALIASSLVAVASARGNTKRPTIALDARIEARAKHVPIQPQDLPHGWLTDPAWDPALTSKLGPVWKCDGHNADLSTLILRGAWSSRNVFTDRSGPWEVTSSVIFLGSVQQAALWFRDGAMYYPRYCAVVGSKQGVGVLRSISRLRLPRVADSELGFRTLITTNTVPIRRGWGDLVILCRDAVCGVLGFGRPGKPFPTTLENEIIRKFASRAHA